MLHLSCSLVIAEREKVKHQALSRLREPREPFRAREACIQCCSRREPNPLAAAQLAADGDIVPAAGWTELVVDRLGLHLPGARREISAEWERDLVHKPPVAPGHCVERVLRRAERAPAGRRGPGTRRASHRTKPRSAARGHASLPAADT